MTDSHLSAPPASESRLEPAAPASLSLPFALRRIVLTGFMGAGKTTVGRLLADALLWDFVDLDTLLETRTSSSIAELFARHGEPGFRRLESSALSCALARDRSVLALGGGTPEQLTNRLLLEQTPGTLVVFLDAPFPILFDRCMLQSFSAPDHVRPVLTSPVEAETRFAARHPLYHRLARITIPTADRTAGETAQALLDALGNQHL